MKKEVLIPKFFWIHEVLMLEYNNNKIDNDVIKLIDVKQHHSLKQRSYIFDELNYYIDEEIAQKICDEYYGVNEFYNIKSRHFNMGKDIINIQYTRNGDCVYVPNENLIFNDLCIGINHPLYQKFVDALKNTKTSDASNLGVGIVFVDSYNDCELSN